LYDTVEDLFVWILYWKIIQKEKKKVDKLVYYWRTKDEKILKETTCKRRQKSSRTTVKKN